MLASLHLTIYLTLDILSCMATIREKLKEIATETVQQAGIEAVTFRDLGKAVGIKSSSVIYHFKNKDGLMLEIAQDYVDGFFNRIKEIDDNFDQPRDKLTALVDLFEEVVLDGKLCLCGMLASDLSALDDKTAHVVKRFFERLEAWIAKVITSRGHYSDEYTADLAYIILSGLEGAMLLDKTVGQTKRLTAMKGWIRTLCE